MVNKGLLGIPLLAEVSGSATKQPGKVVLKTHGGATQFTLGVAVSIV